jgi:hypothetical protein
MAKANARCAADYRWGSARTRRTDIAYRIFKLPPRFGRALPARVRDDEVGGEPDEEACDERC